MRELLLAASLGACASTSGRSVWVPPIPSPWIDCDYDKVAGTVFNLGNAQVLSGATIIASMQRVEDPGTAVGEPAAISNDAGKFELAINGQHKLLVYYDDFTFEWELQPGSCHPRMQIGIPSEAVDAAARGALRQYDSEP